jgi:hypothetical protein
MRFLPSVIGISITAKVAVIGTMSSESKNLMSVYPHPRYLIEAVTPVAPVSFDEYVKAIRGPHTPPAEVPAPVAAVTSDDTFCQAPLSEKSRFLPSQSEMLAGGGKMMEMFLDTFAAKIRLNLADKIVDIYLAWENSVGKELGRIGTTMRGEIELYASHQENVGKLASAATDPSTHASPLLSRTGEKFKSDLSQMPLTGLAASTGKYHHLQSKAEWEGLGKHYGECENAAKIIHHRTVSFMERTHSLFVVSFRSVRFDNPPGHLRTVFPPDFLSAESSSGKSEDELKSYVAGSNVAGPESREMKLYGEMVDKIKESLKSKDGVKSADGVAPRISSIVDAGFPEGSSASSPAGSRFSQKMSYLMDYISIVSSMRFGTEDGKAVWLALRELLNAELRETIKQALVDGKELTKGLGVLAETIGGVYYDAETFTKGVPDETASRESPSSPSGFAGMLKHLEHANVAATDHESQPHRTKYTVMVMRKLHAHIIALAKNMPQREPVDTNAERGETESIIEEDPVGKAEADTPKNNLLHAAICILYDKIDGAQVFSDSPFTETSCSRVTAIGEQVITELIAAAGGKEH